MKIIFLCAGKSNRLKPIKDKILLNFCGKTLFERQITSIMNCGFKDFIIIGNKNNLPDFKIICKKIKKTYPNLKFTFLEQKKSQDGMKGAIETCKNITGKALVVNSNDIVDKDIFDYIRKESDKNNFDSIICGKVVNKYFNGGYLSLNNQGFLTDIVEKPGEGNEPSNLINIVIHYFKSFENFLYFVEKENNENDCGYELALKKFSKKHNIFVYKYDKNWLTIKYPWDIFTINDYYLKNLPKFIHKTAQISENVVIRGNVYLDENVKIFENSVLVGPLYIGKNYIIANNVLIRESSIGANCVIGFNTEVARSFLSDSIWTHSNYIGDSIIDSDVSFGAGTVTGNLRLDEDLIKMNINGQKLNSQKNKLGCLIGSNVRIGINCSLNPGLKIGSNSFISSGVVLQNDVDNDSFLSVKQNLVKKKNIKQVFNKNRSF